MPQLITSKISLDFITPKKIHKIIIENLHTVGPLYFLLKLLRCLPFLIGIGQFGRAPMHAICICGASSWPSAMGHTYPNYHRNQ